MLCWHFAFQRNFHCWESASGPMPPASAFQHPVPEHSATGAFRYRSIPLPDWVLIFRYRTGSGISIFVHSGTVLIGCQTSDIPALIKTYTLHVDTASDGLGYTLHVHSAEGGRGIYHWSRISTALHSYDNF